MPSGLSLSTHILTRRRILDLFNGQTEFLALVNIHVGFQHPGTQAEGPFTLLLEPPKPRGCVRFITGWILSLAGSCALQAGESPVGAMWLSHLGTRHMGLEREFSWILILQCLAFPVCV